MFACIALAVIVPAALVVRHVYGDESNLPDPGPFIRSEFPAIGHVYDAAGQPLIELAREYRSITTYDDIPVVVREAILATEDKRFFDHNGVDYTTVPRVVRRIRLRTLVARLFRNPVDEADSPAIFPQGGSTITQQLVRGHFLKGLTAGENSRSLRGIGRLTRAVSYVLGARNANMIARKAEEMRLSIWIEEEMTRRFGSKQRAKEEIFARYASHVYMGNGQYGIARAAQYYFGRRLGSLTAADADKAALLAGIPKSPRDYAPTARDRANVLRRRNQTLTLMAANGFLTSQLLADARNRPLDVAVVRPGVVVHAASAVGHVLKELESQGVANGLEDLLRGRLNVYSTIDVRVQQVVNQALEGGLAAYEERHPRMRGIVQGSVVVLGNDGRVLAEAGGRARYNDGAASYSDFNRATEALRQPGSAMKPIVYLAAFRSGVFDLDTVVSDAPISVPDGANEPKWIANYDGRFNGPMPARQALAESRNAAAMWIGARIGIDSVLSAARRLGVKTSLHRFPTTVLGASEMTLLELANAYRTIASGVFGQPYVIRRVVHAGSAVVADQERPAPDVHMDPALLMIQEGLRGVVRLPRGTAHALDSKTFPIPVIGKTGTTNAFRDALFVGSTYGVDGITVAVRIGFDDNRSLGSGETGARLALPVFREVMMAVYRDRLAGPVPAFPDSLEERITSYLRTPAPLLVPDDTTVSSPVTFAGEGPAVRRRGPAHVPLPAEARWLRENGTGAAAEAWAKPR
ncbi:MAG: transglycosylase domain-containing protein [Acidobacteriota bacterium]